jgi:hypothetical protein
MRLAAQIASFVALLLSTAWVIYKPGFDSAVAVAAALAALLSAFFLKKSDTPPMQKQDVSGGGVGIQAGRDAKVDNFQRK